MRIQELSPYKSNPVYQQAKSTFDNVDGEKDRREKLKNFTQYLEQHGFKKLGQGTFAATYESPRYPYVFKIFNNDSAYKTYLDYVLKNQNNPNVPKIKGTYIKINNDTYAVRMEKLKVGKFWWGDNEVIDALDTYNHHRPLSPEAEELLKTKYPGIYKVITDLTKISKDRHSFDLYTGNDNVMWRGDVPVITDPLAH